MTPLTNQMLMYTLISWISLIINLFSIFLVVRSYLSSKSRPLIYLIIIYTLLTPFFIVHTILYLVGFEQKTLMVLL